MWLLLSASCAISGCSTWEKKIQSNHYESLWEQRTMRWNDDCNNYQWEIMRKVHGILKKDLNHDFKIIGINQNKDNRKSCNVEVEELTRVSKKWVDEIIKNRKNYIITV